MSPELTVFTVVAASVALAYTAVYPRMKDKTLAKLIRADLMLTGALLLAVGLACFGTHTGFTLLFFEVPWWVFTIVVLSVVEAPFVWWFCKTYDIDLTPPGD